MAGYTTALTIAAIIVLAYSTNYRVYCTNPQCVGTECTAEDLLGITSTTTTTEQVVQNLTTTISRILEGQLRIHIIHDYNGSSCGVSSESVVAPSTPDYPRDCGDIAALGRNKSGVYTIQPMIHAVAADNEMYKSKVEVYCDLESDDGDWTVFQRRRDGSVGFYRGWEEYKRGFGYFESEFWLGLDKLHRLTTQDRYQLKVTVEDASGNKVYATYDDFRIGDESTSYKLFLGDHEGTAPDSLRSNANMQFSTKDRDNDVYSGHCAQRFKGGWWYDACHNANLNGAYLTPGVVDSTGITWWHWKGDTYETLKSTEMKIRRME